MMKEEEERKRRVWGVSYKLQITFIPPKKDKTYNLIKMRHIKSCSFVPSPHSVKQLSHMIVHNSSLFSSAFHISYIVFLSILPFSKILKKKITRVFGNCPLHFIPSFFLQLSICPGFLSSFLHLSHPSALYYFHSFFSRPLSLLSYFFY